MQYLMPFILAMVVTMAWLPVLVRFARRWGIIDAPGARKVHATPIPRVGGLAMTFGVLIAALLTIHLQPQDRWFLAAAAVLVIFGTIDDRFDLDYRIKLIGQLIAVGIVVFGGDIQAHSITLDEKVLLPDWLSVSLTVLFLVGVTNAINLADGLDGLAGGTTFLCLCAIALLASVGGQGSSIALALAFAGAVIGFLRFNTFPASVFMGDAGSQLLGFTVGVLSVRATQSEMSQISASIPILLLALPILDTLSVMVQRIGEGRSPFSADKNHIHHKLLAMGFDHHEAVMVIYSLQATLFVTAYILRFESDFLILAVVTTFFAAAILVLQLATRSRWQVRTIQAVPAASMRPGSAPQPGVSQAPRRSLASAAAVVLLPRAAYWAIAVGLVAYASLIVIDTGSLPGDFRMLILLLLAVIVGFSAVLRTAPLTIVEKGALYVTATTLVYIDTILLPENRGLSALTWAAVGIAVAGTAIRLRLNTDRRFQITPLDLIVLFMALVVPSLPGTLSLPEGGALAIAKLVILFYALEVLASRTEARALWLRGAFAAVLAALVVRPLIPF
jgi:UDP-GlcNAc:undecaprenyl-phosphate GlcNAc-1-phosphate transferase